MLVIDRREQLKVRRPDLVILRRVPRACVEDTPCIGVVVSEFPLVRANAENPTEGEKLSPARKRMHPSHVVDPGVLDQPPVPKPMSGCVRD